MRENYSKWGSHLVKLTANLPIILGTDKTTTPPRQCDRQSLSKSYHSDKILTSSWRTCGPQFFVCCWSTCRYSVLRCSRGRKCTIDHDKCMFWLENTRARPTGVPKNLMPPGNLLEQLTASEVFCIAFSSEGSCFSILTWCKQESTQVHRNWVNLKIKYQTLQEQQKSWIQLWLHKWQRTYFTVRYRNNQCTNRNGSFEWRLTTFLGRN